MKAQSLSGVSKDNQSVIESAFKDYFTAKFPFAAKVKKEADKKLVARMKKEVSRGPLRVTAITANPLRDRAKQLRQMTPQQQDVLQRARKRVT